MADWEAQKSFVHKTAGGVFRPSTSLTGFAAIWGWAWRFILFILVPILAYLFLVVKYAKSKEFGKSLTEETQRYFGAGETSVRAARWDMDGNLRVGVVEVKGGPGNIFKDLTLENFESTISLFDLYKPAWTLKNADAFSAHIYLRSGLAETTAAADVRATSPLLRAAVLNPGIHPDFSQLKIESYSSKNLNLYWGASAATSA